MLLIVKVMFFFFLSISCLKTSKEALLEPRAVWSGGIWFRAQEISEYLTPYIMYSLVPMYM